MTSSDVKVWQEKNRERTTTKEAIVYLCGDKSPAHDCSFNVPRNCGIATHYRACGIQGDRGDGGDRGCEVPQGNVIVVILVVEERVHNDGGDVANYPLVGGRVIIHLMNMHGNRYVAGIKRRRERKKKKVSSKNPSSK